ncbi:MAG: alpha/beta hydrolase family esterase [Allorhizobium sp.]
MPLKLPMSLASALRRQTVWNNAFLKIVTPVAKVAAKRVRRVAPPATRLSEVITFGSNPGQLRMLEYVPPKLGRGAPLVVVLHGCRQTAAEFDRGSGWSKLAREKGFAVVYAEQRRANNANLCFNWFRPSAVARDRGELMSIRQMIDDIRKRHRLSATRIYVMGLSAGGAMTSALLAVYPDLFAGGAIVAGLPYGAARDAMSALSVMRNGSNRSGKEWGDLVRGATEPAKRLPVVSIWHGTADRTVSVANAEASLEQWLDVYGLSEQAGVQTVVGDRTVRQWQDGKGRTVIDLHLVQDMDHGLPVKRPRAVSERNLPYMLEAGVSAPAQLVKLWNIGGT